ncbi:hypothetical protein C9175_23740 [Escherichia coli]|nr:hypothetical protein DS960_25020 [Escherichia coli]RCQ90852.1 hypothetical protein A6592_26430 [Escherichia coli]TJE58356.1 hypothetical protein C9213_23410 [Escherichia coli]TJG23678.1 hypothetical protein C9175_23740 [Escherichia coli]TJT10854.1 hypothetical protein C9Z00_24145 [Escherichia coli]
MASLLLPVANIIAAEEEQRLAPEDRAALRRRKSLTQYVQNELNAAWHDGTAFVFTNVIVNRTSY